MGIILKNIKTILSYRELLLSLTLREIKVKYKQSVLGVLWAILQPLSMMIIFTIVFSKFVRIPSDGIPYPIFSYSAILPWSFFVTSLSFASNSILNNAALVNKIYFPREIFPISAILAAFVDFLIASVIFLAMSLFYQITIKMTMIYLIPILLIQIALTLGIAFFTSAVNVRFRDIKYAVPLFMQLWMYASPIIYPISVVPERYRFIYSLNPMTGIIDSYRKVILEGDPPNFKYLGISIVVTLAIVFYSYRYFKEAEKTFADVI